MTPTWAGWPAVIVAQNADVESHSDCLFAAAWNIVDVPDWVPDVYDTGLTWDFCIPEVPVSASFNFTNTMDVSHRDLWSPVDSEDTQWFHVNYPN